MSSTAQREPLLTVPFMRMWSLSFFTFLSAFQLFPTIPFRILALGGTKAEAGLFLGVYTYAAALCAPWRQCRPLRTTAFCDRLNSPAF